jgi:hypothetical protein
MITGENFIFLITIPAQSPSGRGLLTEEGKAKCAAAKTVHGNATKARRTEYKAQMAELYELEMLGRKIGLISGPKTAGRKPKI